MIPESLQRLIDELMRLPGVGRRSAERFAYHLLQRPKEEAMRLGYAIRDLKKLIRPCAICCLPTEAERCPICLDPARDAGLLCVVEQPRDVYALERLGTFKGVYHVLMGALALLDGIEAKDLTIQRLEERLQSGGVREVILATNPNLEGDTTALHLALTLRGAGAFSREGREGVSSSRAKVKITRLARGLSAGSAIDAASRPILEDALEGRREVQ